MENFVGERLDGVKIKMPPKEENQDYFPAE